MDRKYVITFAVFVALAILETFFPLFPGRRKRLWHWGKNLALVVINNLVFLLLFSSVTAAIFIYIDDHRIGLFNWLSVSPYLRIVSAIIFFDLWMYIWHRLTHLIPFLWRFHRMHHSDVEMDASTAIRFHFGEIIFSSIARFAVFALLGLRILDLAIYESIMLPVILFHHSNFFLPEKVDRVLRLFIPTPWMHWVHHSRIREETDSNFGTILSWWDRLFGTFRLRQNPREIEFGIDGFSEPTWQNLWGMLKTPFV